MAGRIIQLPDEPQSFLESAAESVVGAFRADIEDQRLEDQKAEKKKEALEMRRLLMAEDQVSKLAAEKQSLQSQMGDATEERYKVLSGRVAEIDSQLDQLTPIIESNFHQYGVEPLPQPTGVSEEQIGLEREASAIQRERDSLHKQVRASGETLLADIAGRIDQWDKLIASGNLDENQVRQASAARDQLRSSVSVIQNDLIQSDSAQDMEQLRQIQRDFEEDFRVVSAGQPPAEVQQVPFGQVEPGAEGQEMARAEEEFEADPAVFQARAKQREQERVEQAVIETNTREIGLFTRRFSDSISRTTDYGSVASNGANSIFDIEKLRINQLRAIEGSPNYDRLAAEINQNADNAIRDVDTVTRKWVEDRFHDDPTRVFTAAPMAAIALETTNAFRASGGNREAAKNQILGLIQAQANLAEDINSKWGSYGISIDSEKAVIEWNKQAESILDRLEQSEAAIEERQVDLAVRKSSEIASAKAAAEAANPKPPTATQVAASEKAKQKAAGEQANAYAAELFSSASRQLGKLIDPERMRKNEESQKALQFIFSEIAKDKSELQAQLQSTEDESERAEIEANLAVLQQTLIALRDKYAAKVFGGQVQAQDQKVVGPALRQTAIDLGKESITGITSPVGIDKRAAEFVAGSEE